MGDELRSGAYESLRTSELARHLDTTTLTPRFVDISPETAPEILARHVRGGIVESVHRGHIVQVDANGSVIRVAGDPDAIVALRSCVKPFTLVALRGHAVCAGQPR